MNYRFGPFVVDLVDFDRFVTPRVTDLLISNDTYMYLVNGTSLSLKRRGKFLYGVLCNKEASSIFYKLIIRPYDQAAFETDINELEF